MPTGTDVFSWEYYLHFEVVSTVEQCLSWCCDNEECTGFTYQDETGNKVCFFVKDTQSAIDQVIPTFDTGYTYYYKEPKASNERKSFCYFCISI